MSELYRDFIDRKTNDIINILDGVITPTATAELYRDFINIKANDVITALNGTITPPPAGGELYRDFLNRKFNDVIAGIGSYIPPVSFPTVSGSIVTFNSQYALPLKSHKIALTATQSGYSAINISATGKNLFSSTIVQGALYRNGSENTTTVTRVKTYDYIPCKPNTQYTVSFNSGVIAISVVYYDNGKVYLYGDNLNGATFTTPDKCSYVRFGIAKTETTQSITPSDVTQSQLELGDIVTTYEVYNGTYTPINIGQTVNEATYNARTGVLEVTQPSLQTIQLPPCPIDILQGMNNIWADTGDTTLQYIKIGGNT